MRYFPVTGLGFVVALLSGCCSLTQLDKTQETQRLLKADQDFAALSMRKNASEAFSAYLAKDAVQLPAESEPIKGSLAIVAGMKMDENLVLSWIPRFAEVAAAGDLGWTWGTYAIHDKRQTPTSPLLTGKYVNVWRHNSEGRWEVILDIGNQAPTLPKK